MSNIYPGGDHQYSTNLGLGLWGTDEVTTDNFLLIDAAIGSGSSVRINGTVIPNVNFVNSVTATLSVAGNNVSIITVPAPPTPPGGLLGAIQYNDAGVFGGSAAEVDAAGDMLVPGVFSQGNAAIFPTNPPLTNNGWFNVTNTDNRVGATYYGHISAYTVKPASFVSGTNYIAGRYTAQTDPTSTFRLANLTTLNLIAENLGTGLLDLMVGSNYVCSNIGSGTVTNSIGLQVLVDSVSSGNIGTEYGVSIVTGNAGTGTITTNYGLYVESVFATGLVSNNYGIFIGDQSLGGANNPNSYALYVQGGKSYFAGSVILNSTLVDSFSSPGTLGQFLISTGTGVEWTSSMFSIDGNILFNPDNTYSIGLTGTSRPSVGYFGTTVNAPMFLVGSGVSGGGSPAFVQAKSVSDNNTASNIVLSPSSSITTGNLVLVYVQFYNNPATPTITDNTGLNTYTTLSGPDGPGSDPNTYHWVFACTSILGSPSTVTVNGGAVTYRAAVLVEFSGQSVTSPVDQVLYSNAASGSTWTSGNITTTALNETVVALGGTENGATSFTQGAGYSLAVNNSNGNGPAFGEYKSAVTIGVYNATVTLSVAQPGAMYLISIKGTAGNIVYDAGISRLAAASIAIGNGTAGNTSGNISLNRVNLAGADFAGQATITAGTTTKAVAFTNNYTGTGQPVIVLTPTSDPLALGVPVGYWVTYSGSAGAWTGWTLNIQTALAGNVVFNYVVIGVA